jgi:diguanylate cyclase (GGDEF)-like protein
MRFKELSILTDEIDKAFEDFYNTLLKELRFSVFFANDEQIALLIAKQKEHFAQMLQADSEVIKESYIKLGEYHHKINIPYIDFMKGTEILEKHFLLHAQELHAGAKLFEEIFDFFKLIKSYTAKGYLNKMIANDREDIALFFEEKSSEEETYLPKKIVLQKIEWLRNLLDAIESQQEYDVMKSENYFVSWLNEFEFLSEEKRKFFEEIDTRIHVNTKNLFFFLQQSDYLEVLPLYTSLLNIYKLTLLLNNSITLLYANHMISDLKVDKLTGLYRKEMFEQLLFKELAFAKRNDNYNFAVVFIDLDDFKYINDNYGHYSGDKVLEKLGGFIGANIRASDSGFRIGGDELAILLKDINHDEVLYVVDKIHKSFRQENFVFNDEVSFSATLSIGIVVSNEDDFEDTQMLIEAVDNKLYKAKAEGKNKYII